MVVTCIKLSLRKLTIMIARSDKISKLSYPRTKSHRINNCSGGKWPLKALINHLNTILILKISLLTLNETKVWWKHLRLNLKLPQMRPELRLMRLQKFLKEQTQANDSLWVSIDGCETMAVPDVKRAKGKVQRYRIVIQITKGSDFERFKVLT